MQIESSTLKIIVLVLVILMKYSLTGLRTDGDCHYYSRLGTSLDDTLHVVAWQQLLLA